MSIKGRIDKLEECIKQARQGKAEIHIFTSEEWAAMTEAERAGFQGIRIILPKGIIDDEVVER